MVPDMRKVKKASRIFALMAVVIGLFISGCESRFFNNDELVYSSMWGEGTSFSLDKMFYSVGDEIGIIKDCSSIEYPNCIIFDSTIIMLPRIDIFDDIVDGHYKGRNESLDLDYKIRKLEINVLGRKIKGYLFKVAHSNEMIGGEHILGTLKGDYFYSMSDGVLFYDHNYEMNIDNQKQAMLPETNWSTTGCGFFSNKCKEK